MEPTYKLVTEMKAIICALELRYCTSLQGVSVSRMMFVLGSKKSRIRKTKSNSKQNDKINKPQNLARQLEVS